MDRHTHTPAPLWGQWLVEQWHSAQEQSSLFGEDDSAQEQHQTGSLSPQSFYHQLAFEHQLGSPGAWCKGQKGNIGDGAYPFCVCFLCHSLCRLAIQDPLELCELTLIQGVLARLLQQTLHALDFSSHLAKGTSFVILTSRLTPELSMTYVCSVSRRNQPIAGYKKSDGPVSFHFARDKARQF